MICSVLIVKFLSLRFIGLSLGGSTSFSSSCFSRVVATLLQTASLRVCNGWVSLGEPRLSEEAEEEPSELLLALLSVLDRLESSIRASQAVAASGDTLGLGGVSWPGEVGQEEAWLLAARYRFLNGFGALGWDWLWLSDMVLTEGRLEEDKRWLLQLTPLFRPGEEGV